jgi:hypothetical protein
LELALWKLKIASMVPVLLRFASIALLAASRPPTAVMATRMFNGHTAKTARGFETRTK